jgi:hypothetical protein
MVSLADYKDAKGFIVTFTCNHCPFQKHMKTASLHFITNILSLVIRLLPLTQTINL